jgi:hypothetical protein
MAVAASTCCLRGWVVWILVAFRKRWLAYTQFASVRSVGAFGLDGCRRTQACSAGFPPQADRCEQADTAISPHLPNGKTEDLDEGSSSISPFRGPAFVARLSSRSALRLGKRGPFAPLTEDEDD